MASIAIVDCSIALSGPVALLMPSSAKMGYVAILGGTTSRRRIGSRYVITNLWLRMLGLHFSGWSSQQSCLARC